HRRHVPGPADAQHADARRRRRAVPRQGRRAQLRPRDAHQVAPRDSRRPALYSPGHAQGAGDAPSGPPTRMLRRRRIVLGASLAALAGAVVLFAAIAWVIWTESVDSEEAYAGGLAEV